jgi:hypothetical protein
MSLRDIAGIVNIVGVTLMLIFFIPWRGRPPRNKVLGNIGFAMVFAASVTVLGVWASGRW